jgi:hypothetical protein
MRGESRLLRPRARSGSPTTPRDCRPFTTAPALSSPWLSRSRARQQPGKGPVAREARRRPAWCGTRPRHSWFRERSYRPHSSGPPRTGRFPPGPGASVTSPRPYPPTTQSSPSTTRLSLMPQRAPYTKVWFSGSTSTASSSLPPTSAPERSKCTPPPRPAARPAFMSRQPPTATLRIRTSRRATLRSASRTSTAICL